MMKPLSDRELDRLCCTSPGCGEVLDPPSITASLALALVEHRASRKNQGVIRASCPRCKTLCTLNREAILSQIRTDRRPRDLNADEAMALVLIESSTTDDMPYRGFFGERILVRVMTQGRDSWNGRLLGPSQLAPQLAVGSEVRGELDSGFHVCTDVARDNGWAPLPVQTLFRHGQLASIGTFFKSKSGTSQVLQSANAFCSNPSCPFIHSPTYSSVQQHLRSMPRERGAVDEPVEGAFAATCLLCGSSRVLDLESFDDLFKV